MALGSLVDGSLVGVSLVGGSLVGGSLMGGGGRAAWWAGLSEEGVGLLWAGLGGGGAGPRVGVCPVGEGAGRLFRELCL